jgi:23S rRNA pseudouridine2605 synthase
MNDTGGTLVSLATIMLSGALSAKETMPDKSADRPARTGERVAKVIARAGFGSRREAEEMIAAGRVAINGTTITTPALNVTPSDSISVDGKPLPRPERTRLFLYHKPRGLMTTHHDPEGRPTVFAALPGHLPRLLSVGRLDFNTEGLLLLTNDGGLARILELPETGWLRRYRVRAHGRVEQEQLDRLRGGVTIEGMHYGPIEAALDREQGSNVWLTIGIREGKNREVRNVLEHLGLEVTRLIRVSFGPFQLGDIEEGAVEEVPTRVLRDQLGERIATEASADFEGPVAPRDARSPTRDRPPREQPRGGRGRDEGRDRREERPRDGRGGGRAGVGDREREPRRPFKDRGPRRDRDERPRDDRRSRGGDRDREQRPPFRDRGPRPDRGDRPRDERRTGGGDRGREPRRPFQDRGPRPARGERPRDERRTGGGDRDREPRRPFRDRGSRPARGERPRDERRTGGGDRDREPRRPFRERGPRPDRGERPRDERRTGGGDRDREPRRPFRDRGPRPDRGERPRDDRGSRSPDDREQRRGFPDHERSERPRPKHRTSSSHVWRPHEEGEDRRGRRGRDRGSRRDESETPSAPRKTRSGLIADRKGRNVLVERVQSEKPEPPREPRAKGRGRRPDRGAGPRRDRAGPRSPRPGGRPGPGRPNRPRGPRKS